MVLALSIDRRSIQRPTYRKLRDPAEEVELFRWACFLDQADTMSAFDDPAVDALLDAAEGDQDLLHAAWMHALRAQRYGAAKRSTVELVHRALERGEREVAPH
jgi:hypothetical protein